ncbi:phosphate ABC transporter ATP-binding protein [Pseudoteredinibacter isoporae]|uniref:phosphate ABC transporter ATP-binding protein n=1 Tax=Pseudoteredinibacter isoporae TaxID=570281 RepID=UPI0033424FA8
MKAASIDLEAGTVSSLVGPSGSGKSSLLASINRLNDLQQARTTGEIEIDGKNILDNDISVSALRKQVGMVFQKPNPFPLSIAENIKFPLREHGIKNKNTLNEKLEHQLKQVGLWDEVKDRLNDSALQLSGGQQQRLCIARALALSPKVLLLDEPCSALDPIATARIEDLITKLKSDYTIFMVTHNLAQARRISDKVAVCWVKDNTGYIVESGPTEIMFTQAKEAISQHYINGTLAGS